ncbi:MAG: HNH endonuclease [Proteobacteria bacterium]|nr:HNH endonuclease [Pseudomonadota bacterium]MBU4469160.1 HNH endonuclease [Pseudomonadota bacterium]MCG2752191.1 HNH endonuclease [Desulfobacteraceae bacterium]
MNDTGNKPTYFISADETHVRNEKQKARDMRQSQWWKRQLAKGVCHYCNENIPAKELTMDHIVPIIRGGKSSKGNTVPCCKECNSRKKYLLPMEWETYLERLKKQ